MLADRLLKAPQARKSAIERNGGDRQIGVSQPLCGRFQTCARHDLFGARLQMSLEQAPDMAAREAETGCKRLGCGGFVGQSRHEFSTTIRRGLRAAPGRGTGCALGTAPQTGAEPRSDRAFGVGTKDTILAFGDARGADRATKNAGRFDAGVEYAVITRITLAYRAIALIEIKNRWGHPGKPMENFAAQVGHSSDNA